MGQEIPDTIFLKTQEMALQKPHAQSSLSNNWFLFIEE